MSSKLSILSCVPKGWTLRPQQTAFLLEVEREYENADVFICNLPVSLGKTLLSVVVSAWANKKYKHKSAILQPDNQLLDQFTKSFPAIHTLRRKDSYTCEVYANQTKKESCPSHKAIMQKGMKGKAKSTYCAGCPYVAAMRKTHVMPYQVVTYHTALAYKITPEVLIIDEAHLVQDLIKDLMSRKIWRHEYNYPHYVKTYQQLYHWVRSHPKVDSDTKLGLLKKELEGNDVNYLVERTTDNYRGEDREVLKLLPVDVSSAPPYLWPSKVKKIFLFSGTINMRDAEELGLTRRRTAYIKGVHPIPLAQRPLYYNPIVSLSYANVDRDLPKLVEYLEQMARDKPGRGFIHAPYSLAEKLKEKLTNPRFISHGRKDKRQVFQEWKESEDGILVASGMYEGISLDGDVSRWQVITKVPWPSLAEPAMKYMAQEDSEGYNYSALRPLAQAYGRIARSDTDYGETYMVDVSFKRLYKEAQHLFPEWFLEAVQVEHNQEALK